MPVRQELDEEYLRSCLLYTSQKGNQYKHYSFRVARHYSTFYSIYHKDFSFPILVRLIVFIFHEVLVEIVNLVRPSVEDFLGFLRRLTIEAQACLLYTSRCV